ncbi:MAG: flagellar filament capping protein FliD [Terracidiphilus sp.]
MGTVGLSFGSPTSGAGFNVSSTVAEIVANLQNVETPWKNQLSSLESQDTVISNLGSLLSNVATDLSSLTDFNGIIAQKTGSSSDTNVLELTAATSSAAAGTHTVVVNSLAQTSSGYLAEVASSSATLSGSVTLQVGGGTAQTITLNSSDNTLAGLASAINNSGVGITASVLTDASGSRLSLVSGTSGAGGSIFVTNNSLTAAAANTLGATVTAGSGTTTSTAVLSPVANSSETLTGSLTVAVGSGAQQQISMSAVNTAEGGTTLSDLQQYIAANSSTLGFTASVVTNSDGTASLQLTSGTAGSAGTLAVSSSLVDSSTSLAYTSTVTGSNASLTVDGVNLTSASNTVSNLIPGITFQLLGTSSAGSQVQVVIANDNSGVESTVNQFVSDYNSLMSAINAQEGTTSSGTAEPLFGSPTLTMLQQELLSSINASNPNGTLSSISSTAGVTLSGSMTLQVGGGTTYTFNVGAGTSSGSTYYTGSGNNTLADLASTINSANIGVTAGIATSNGQSTLTLTSQTAGSKGALSVTSAIQAATPTALGYTDAGYTSTTADSGTLGSVAASTDSLSGSVTLQAGSGTPQTITLNSSDNTLSGLMNAINSANLGVTASLNSAQTGILLTSNAVGSAGALTVTSNLYDTTDATTSTLSYTNASDINNLSSLGISVNNNGTLTFDASSLDSVLNTDYSSVAGFFQNADSWGQSFSNMLNNAGSSSPTGMLALASSANSTIESTLNAEISREQSYISAQQSSLTTELNQANQILQQLPTQLQGMNEIYSAITGYNQTTNG